MEKHKIDESVKAGLQIEGDTSPQKKNPVKDSDNEGASPEDAAKELDADELVHEQGNEPVITAEDDEHDIDDLVHTMPPSKTVQDNDEKDPDDLVHQK